jgi:tetratricopeptide (TPR) repeat protein
MQRSYLYRGHLIRFRLIFLPLAATLLFCLSLSGPPRADAALASRPARNAVLQQARNLLQKADYEPSAARKAAELLGPLAQKTPKSAEVPLLLAEAWYRAADAGGNLQKTYPLFKKAGHYAKLALQIDPQQQGGHYWLGLAELRKAQKVGGLRAYFITRHAIEELEKVCRNRPAYDAGGASRVLCLLYRVAPGWSPFGDIHKSIAYGRQAVQAAPNYPLNHYYLAESYLKANNKVAAAAQFRKILELPSPNHFAAKARHQLQAMERKTD